MTAYGLWDELKTASRSRLTPGKSGAVEVKSFEVTKADEELERMRSMFGGGRRHVRAGVYTGLYRNGGLWMSDTHDEINDFLPFAVHARGSVLVTGLGLGCTVNALLANPAVSAVTVLEIDSDVIALVGSQIANPALTIIHANALTYKPSAGERYDCAWHDIWPNLCTDNLEEMTKLSRRWSRRIPRQEFWGREILRYQRERDRRSGWAS